jgi:predicted AAA+ superfamily ATPase
MYGEYYQAMLEKNADLPLRCTRAEYNDEMRAAYPFHPELLTTLNRKTATIPNFNQTRGALRLLAWAVRSLWEKKPKNTWMIHPYHLDLAQPQIAEDLTSRLDRPKFRQVIEADIVSPLLGTSAHSQEIDKQYLSARRPPYAQRLSTTIFLHSLTQGVASGTDSADLTLATLTPDGSSGISASGDDPALVAKALESLVDKAWFLEYDGHRYRFKTEPSINKIIADETLQVGSSKAKGEIDGRISLTMSH